MDEMDRGRLLETLVCDRRRRQTPVTRNVRWFKMHPWFEAEVIPALRERVTEVLSKAKSPGKGL